MQGGQKLAQQLQLVINFNLCWETDSDCFSLNYSIRRAVNVPFLCGIRNFLIFMCRWWGWRFLCCAECRDALIWLQIGARVVFKTRADLHVERNCLDGSLSSLAQKETGLSRCFNKGDWNSEHMMADSRPADGEIVKGMAEQSMGIGVII